jgi:hypothetical protein
MARIHYSIRSAGQFFELGFMSRADALMSLKYWRLAHRRPAVLHEDIVA